MTTLRNVIPFKAKGHEIELLITKTFRKEMLKVFTRDELTGLFNYVSAQPDAGDVIPGTGGLRKLRWRARGKGTLGGGRVIYYFRDLNMPLLFLAAYAKGVRADLSKAHYQAIEAKVAKIVENNSFDVFYSLAGELA